MKRMNHKIEYGDKIFARLTIGQRIITEFMINRVADLSELIAEMRYVTRGIRGLATLHIRNQSKGWSAERPLMLYTPRIPQPVTTPVTSPFQTTTPKQPTLFPHFSL